MFLAKRKILTNASNVTFTLISVVVSFSLFFLCSCSPKKTTASQNSTTKTVFCSHSQSKSSLEEAKQFDALVPLGFRCTEKRLSSAHDNQILLVHYEGTQSLARTISFYKRELEAAGWDLSDFSSDQDGLFFCRKGNQECAITIHAKGKTIITFSYRIKTVTQGQPTSDVAQINKPFKF